MELVGPIVLKFFAFQISYLEGSLQSFVTAVYDTFLELAGR
jgi:hypothetical protein